MNKSRFITKLRNLWFDSIKIGSEVLFKKRGEKLKHSVVGKDGLHKKLLLNPGDDQHFWANITDCEPIPKYMNTDIYKALTEGE